MKELTIVNQNGTLLVDSREVAEMTGKEHKNLLRDIKGYIEVLESSKLSSQKFFIESTYKNSQNKEQPCYMLSRKGCDLVANKMTGEKGILFTAQYVTKFEEMEFSLINPISKLSKELKAIFVLDEKQQELEKKVDNLENNIPLFNIECEELQKALKRKGTQLLGGKGSKAYSDKSLRTKLYSDIQREIKRQFGLHSYKALKRKQLNIALEIIDNYKMPLIIQDEINLLNNQMSF